MNIFFSNNNPNLCALDHCRVHRNKQIIEYAQLLSTAHHVLDGDKALSGIYKVTHANHPSAVWVRESNVNYSWLVWLLHKLCCEYEQDRGKPHKTASLLDTLYNVPSNIPQGTMTPIKLAMPEEYQQQDASKAYQDYLNDKYLEWLTRPKPMKVEWCNGVPDWVNNDVRELLK